MTSDNTLNATTPLAHLQLHSQSLKAISWQLLQSLYVLAQASLPSIRWELKLNSQALADHHYEVGLQAELTGQQQDRAVFRLNIEQAGYFTVSGLTPEDLDHALKVTAPQLLYGALRLSIAQTTAQAGLAPLFLEPVDFEARYRQALEAKATVA